MIINNTNHIALNTNTSTGNTTISTSFYNNTTWHTKYTLSSDHLPIFMTLNTNTKYNNKKHSYTNYKKVNWKQYTEDTEAAFSCECTHHITHTPTHSHIPNNTLTIIILQTDKQHIPKGKMHNIHASFCKNTSDKKSH